jgi:hypothetical protein
MAKLRPSSGLNHGLGIKTTPNRTFLTEGAKICTKSKWVDVDYFILLYNFSA